MIVPEWRRNPMLTPAEEARSLDEFKRFFDQPVPPKCTCVNCMDRYVCACSFDPYNTDDDCLYEK